MIRKKKKSNSVMKKITSLTLVCSLGIGMISGIPVIKVKAEEATKTYDYGRAWQQTLMFYEFQKQGDLSNTIERNNWRGNCCLNDGQDVGLDLTGGWSDAGDHVKFNLPMSYSATMLAWSYLVNEETYKQTGQDVYMLDEVKWVNDYFIKCHPEENIYYYQVGNGDVDHQFWGAPELLELDEVVENRDMVRPSYYVTNEAKKGGSAVCAGTAASLAAASIIFKESDPEYSELCLKHAKELYTMALEAMSDEGYQKKAMGYYTSTHFQDELTWGGAWLCKATGEKSYLETAKSFGHSWGGEEMIGDLRGNVWAQCWDDVRYGAMLLVAQLDDSEEGLEYREGIEYNLDYWSTGVVEGNGTVARGNYTPNGLVMINDWGSLRYAASEAFMATLYANWEDADPERAKTYMEFAKSQADYILGSSGRSYIVGYDETSPVNPHHRAAHGAWKNSPLGYPDTNRHTLVGALVGGPRANESYEDDRNNYCTNEVADDYNAGVVGLMAAMYEEYGGTIDPDINAVEEVSDEYYMDGCNYQKGDEYCEVKLTIENHTAWPARGTDNLMFRYFVDISDVLEQGYTADDFNVICYYAQRKLSVTQLLPWNVEEGIYYVEVALGQDEALLKAYDEQGITYQLNGQATSFMYPCGDVECRCDMQLRIEAPVKWDYTKSPTYSDIADTEVDEKKQIYNVGIYEDGEIVDGTEPSKEGEIVIVKPTTEETTENNSTESTTSQEGTEQGATEQIIPVSTIRLNEIKTELSVGETKVLQAIIEPDNATDKTVEWTSSKPEVATVDENGKVQAVSEGTTTITATTKDGKKTAESVVTVSGTITEDPNFVHITSITLGKIKTTLTPGEKYQMQVVILPTDASDQTVTWTSSNTDVATINADGVLTAVAAGETTILVTTKDGNKTAAVKITVEGEKGTLSTEQDITEQSTSENTTEVVTTERSTSENTTEVVATEQNTSENTTEVVTTEQSTSENTTEVVTTEQTTSETATTENTTEESKITDIIFNTDAFEMTVGESTRLKVTILPDASNANLSWTTSDSSVVAISAMGTVTAKAVGTAEIRVTDSNSGKSAVCTITVKEKEEDKIAVESIVVTPAEKTMKTGETVELEAIIMPLDATVKDVTWTSNNKEIAEVDQNGKVTAKAAGEVEISATTVDGGKVAVCKIEVTKSNTNVAVSSITFEKTNVSLEVGNSTHLTATVLPENATNKILTWKSSNPTVATVDTAGIVNAKSSGMTVITATSADGTVTAECMVTVTEKQEEKIAVEQIILSTTNVTLTADGEFSLTATVIPLEATDQTVIWSTADETIAEVDANGKVTAKTPGDTKITATSADGTVTAVCNVKVKEESSSDILVESITLEQKDITLVTGEETTLVATVLPENAANKEIEWNSYSPEIATVDSDGKVHAVAKGVAVITATTVDGGKVVYCTVHVEEKSTETSIAVESVEVTPAKQELTVGESANLTVSITPSTATNQNVTWKSNDETILKVEQNGKITALKEGQTTVIVQTEDGNKLAFCDVTIKAKQQPTTQTTTATTEIKVAQVNVSEKTFTLALKGTKTIKASVSPSNATNKKVTYTSANKTVATVDANGKVKAVAPGITTITVKAASGASAKVKVKVKPAKVTSFKKTKLSNTKVKISWKKQSKVTGYKVYRLNAKTQTYKLYKITKRNYVSVANLKKNATYTFKVKAYKRSGSAVVNGDLSKAFKVKMK